MTTLGKFNYYFMQWFFIRLARVVNDEGAQTGWTLLKWIVPMSGWGTDYKYVGRGR